MEAARRGLRSERRFCTRRPNRLGDAATVRLKILQAASAVLAQANQQPQLAIRLLEN